MASRVCPAGSLESLLAAQRAGRYSDEEVFGNTLQILLAGEDTTAHSLTWTAWFIARDRALQRRLAEPLVRPALLTDRRMVLPNIAGLLTGMCIFISFLAVLQFVQTPPEVAGYGFGAGVLEAAVVYLLPGGVVGIAVAPLAGRVVARAGALPTLLAGAGSGIAGFAFFAGAGGLGQHLLGHAAGARIGGHRHESRRILGLGQFEQCQSSQQIDPPQVSAVGEHRQHQFAQQRSDRDDELAILERNIYARLSEILLHKMTSAGPKGMAADTKITQATLDSLTRNQWWQIGVKNEKAQA